MGQAAMEPDLDRLARSLAGLTGESPRDAVLTAVKERLSREQMRRGRGVVASDDQALDRELERIVQRFAELPVIDARTPDNIIGYDKNGLP